MVRACAALGSLLVLPALADYVELVATDPGGKASFNQGTNWKDNVNPSASSSANIDFLVRNGLQMRTPDSRGFYTFGGRSLTLGDPANPSSKGEMSIKSVCPFDGDFAESGVRIDDLRLYGGIIYMGSGKSFAYLDGKATVYSKRSAPFCFHMGNDDHRMLNIRLALSGADDTGISFTYGTNYLRSVGSGYAGNFQVIGGASGITTLKIDSSVALGKVAETFDPEAIVLDGGSLHLAQGTTFPEADNKGLTVTGRGGEIASDYACNFAWPISGPGELVVFSRPGHTFRMQSNLAVRATVVKDGRFAFDAGFTMADTSSLTLRGGRIQPAYPTCTPTVHNFTYEDGYILFPVSTTSGAVGRIDFRGTFTKPADKKIPLALEGLPKPDSSNNAMVTLLTIPVSAGVVTADDFEVARGYGYDFVPAGNLAVTTDENGLQSVTISLADYILAVNATSPARCDTASHWSDGQMPHANANYVVADCDLRYGTETQWSYVFPGTSLLLVHPNGGTNSVVSYVIKQSEVTFADLRVFDWTGISMGGGVSDTPSIHGHITVNTTPPAYFRLNGGVARVGTFDCTFSGTGELRCVGHSTYKLLADNSGFTGSVVVRAENDYGNLEAVNRPILCVTDETGLGTASAASGSLTLGYHGTFSPLNSLTLDDPNRRLVFTEASPTIRTVDGVELTTAVPLTFQSTARAVKDGSGVWALGGAATAQSGAQLRVVEGSLRIRNAKALEGVSLTFDEGAKLELVPTADAEDPRATYGLLATGGLTAVGETLPVSVGAVRPAAKLTTPLLTVPAAFADALEGKLRPEKIKGYECTLSRDVATYDKKDYVRFTLAYRQSGMALVVR